MTSLIEDAAYRDDCNRASVGCRMFGLRDLTKGLRQGLRSYDNARIGNSV